MKSGIKCRHEFCPHVYHDVVGQHGWTQHAYLKGAECIPCLYASQIVRQGQTLEQIEAVPQIMEQFCALLTNTGWTWQHVKDSYDRIMALSPEIRDREINS